LWLIIGLALCGYSVLSYANWRPAGFNAFSAALPAAIFLFLSMLFFIGFQRFLLGLCAVIWAFYVVQFPSPGASGVGMVLGAVSFSSIISFTSSQNIGSLDFDLRDFIYSIADPFFILDLEGKIVFFNEPFRALSGRERQGLLHSEAIDHFEIPHDWRFKLGPSEQARKVRCQLITANGGKIPVQIHLSEICRVERVLKNLLCLVHEETRIEILENRLKSESFRLASFYETSQALSSSLELKDVLRSIARAAEGLTRSDVCTIFSLEPGSHLLKPIYSSEEEYNAEVMSFELAVGKGLTGAVVAEGRPKIQNFDDETNLATHIPGTGDEKKSLLAMPLIAKGAVIGALTLYKVGGRRFEEEDLKSLTIFASQAASIIETSRLYMKLKASEKLYRYSVDLAGDAILFVDFENGKITDVNEMALKLLKYTRAELLSMHIWELNLETQMSVAKRLWEEVKKTGWGKLGEVDYVSKDGAGTPTSVTVSVIRAGEANFIQWMIRDISDYKRSLEKVGFFHQVFERLDEPIMITGNKGKILYSNDAFSRFFETPREEVARGDVASIDLRGTPLDILNSFWARLRGNNHVVDEVVMESAKGVTKRKTISILPYRGNNGETRYYVWFFYPSLPVTASTPHHQPA
jgi:PAS domain S-box-containing protein